MSLELLISKYIDGELSSQEDEQLRSIIKNDSLAREKFNKTVELHLDLLEDADTIVVPPALLKKTEDRIMMEILKQAPVYKFNDSKKKFNYQNLYKYAAAVLIFLFSAVLTIRDGAFQLSDIFSESGILNEAATEDVKSNDINSLDKSVKNISSAKSVGKKSIARREVNSVINVAAINENTENSFSGESVRSANAEPQNTDQTIFGNVAIDTDINNNITSDNGNTPIVNYQSNNADINNVKNYELNNLPSVPFSFGDRFPMEFNEIHLTSFVSHDFMHTGIKTHDNTSIINYSQSIAYSIDDKSRVGLEVGLTEFNFDMTRYVKVPASTGKNSKVEVLDPSKDNLGYILVPVQVQELEKIYWGSVFYERTLFNNDWISLSGRLGLGSTSDGIMGLLRFSAKYMVINGIYLSAGTEGRLFNMDIPLAGINGTASSISFIYGVHFQF